MKNSLKVSEQNLTVEKIREYLNYDLETGILIWKKKSARNTNIGDRTGSLKPNGYRYIRFDNFECLEHRLIWFGMTGEWPNKEYNIDHIDLNKSNNVWTNLRKVTITENNLHAVARITSKTGFRGIKEIRKSGRYLARIMVNKQEIYIGSYNSIDAAVSARNLKALELGLTTYNLNS